MRELSLPIVVLFALASSALAEDWPNFRGPRYDGISAESGFESAWKEPPQLVWERTVGSAFSSFAVVAGRLYTCGTEDDQQVAFCLNASDGSVIWKRPFEKSYQEAQGGDGTRSTPTVYDGRVYLVGARGKFVCLNAADGAELWSRQFNAMPTWGYSGSVLIDGAQAVVSAGAGDGALAAFDAKTGKPLWKAGDGGVGYATPYAFELDGKRYIAGFLGTSAILVRAVTGEPAWEMPWHTDYDVNASTPIFHDGLLLISSGYTSAAKLLRLQPAGNRIQHEVVWDQPVLRNKFQTPVLFRGALYTGDQEALKCVDFATGKVNWKHRRISEIAPGGGSGNFQHSTVVLADGTLFVLAQDGTLLIGPASPTEFKPTAVVKILEDRCWTVPVLCDGKLFARDLNRIVCYNLKH